MGITAGEHSGHKIKPHSPMVFMGNIVNGSGNVFINGRAAAYAGSTTSERDTCCGSNTGSVAGGSGSVYINGRPAARIGDALAAHSGTGHVSGGSGNVIIGG